MISYLEYVMKAAMLEIKYWYFVTIIRSQFDTLIKIINRWSNECADFAVFILNVSFSEAYNWVDYTLIVQKETGH